MAGNITIGIIEYKTPDLTNKAIQTAHIMKGNINAEIALIINSKETEEFINLKYINSLIVNNKNIMYTKAVNQIIEIAENNDIVLLNSDCLCDKNWLEELHKAAYINLNKKHKGQIKIKMDQ